MRTFEFNKTFKKQESVIEFENNEIKSDFFNTLHEGDGYLLIKGFPVANSSIETSEIDLLDFAFSLGVPVPQNIENEFITRVQDERRMADSRPRGYQHANALPYHSDRCDLLMLCGINPAPTGGETLVVSAEKIHHQISTQFPFSYEVLKEKFPFEKRTEGYNDNQPWYTVPVFSETEDRKMLLWYCRGYIEDSQKHDDCPKLREDQVKALELMSQLVNDRNNCEQVNLQRGEVLILNSCRSLHARNGYPPGSDRLLLRVWISSNDYALPPEFKDVFGNIGKGQYRGGIWSNGLNLDLVPKELVTARPIVKERLAVR